MGVSGKQFPTTPVLLVLFGIAVLVLGALSLVHGQSVPAPSFAHPQQQPVYMVRAWTPVRNLLGIGPLYRPYVQVAPSWPATVTPVAPMAKSIGGT